MDADAFQAAVAAARQEFDAAATSLLARIARAEQTLARDRSRLSSLEQSLAQRLAAIARDYVSAAGGSPALEAASANGHSSSRGTLDAAILDVARGVGYEPSAPEVFDAWGRLHPDTPATRSVVRGVLERAVIRGEMRVAHEGGQGRYNPKRYGFVERGGE